MDELAAGAGCDRAAAVHAERRRGRAGRRAPSYAHGYYDRDNAAYLEWDTISRDRETFTAWLRDVEKGSPEKGDPEGRTGHEAEETVNHTAEEMMTVAAARELRDGQVCFVGIDLPSRAANLARRLHAPGLVLVYESGTVDTKPAELPLSIGDGVLADIAR